MGSAALAVGQTADCPGEPTAGGPQVPLHLVQVDQQILALGAVDGGGGLVESLEHLVEGRQHRGQVRMQAHPIGLAPVLVRRDPRGWLP